MQNADEPRSTTRLAAYAPFWAVIGILFIGALIPGRFTWGFNFWHELPLYLSIPALVFALLCALPPISSRLGRSLSVDGQTGHTRRNSVRRFVVIVVVLVITSVLLWLLRFKALAYGDSLEVLHQFSNWVSGSESTAINLGFHPLAVVLKWTAAEVCRWLAIPADVGLPALMILGGLVGLSGLWSLSGILCSARTSRLMLFVGSLSSGAVLLFAGYIEHYVWAAALSVWTLYFAVAFTQGHCRWYWPLSLSLLTAVFHLLYLPFVVAAMIAIAARRFIVDGDDRWPWLSIRLGIVVVASVAVIVNQFTAWTDAFVPPWPLELRSYWLPDPQHLLDLLNHVLLVAPLGITTSLGSMLLPRRESDAAEQVLLTFVVASGMAAIWVDPTLGAPRDWDLLALYGLPLTIWGLYRLVRRLPAAISASALVLPSAVVMLVAIAPNLYDKSHPRVALERLDALLWQDPHYDADWFESRRSLSWGWMLVNAFDRDDLAEKHFVRRIEAREDSYQAWINLGDIHYRRGELQEAGTCYAQGVQYGPADADLLLTLAQIEQTLGNREAAIGWAEKAVAIAPSDIAILRTLGTLLAGLGRADAALDVFKYAHRLSPGTYEENSNLGLAYRDSDQADSAFVYLRRSLEHSPSDRLPATLAALVQIALELNRVDDAVAFLTDLKTVAPDSPALRSLEAAVTRANSRK